MQWVSQALVECQGIISSEIAERVQTELSLPRNQDISNTVYTLATLDAERICSSCFCTL